MNILDQIKETAIRAPERIAVRSENGSMTYRELDEYTDRLAVFIRNLCGTDKTPLPVYGHKSPYMLVCFLACVKSGRGYCPIDISVPWARAEGIMENVNAPVILACEPLPEAKDGGYLFSSRVLTLADITECVQAPAAEAEARAPLCPVSGDDIFYMIFTSGSTGRPKGVQITADCLDHYLDWSVSLGTSMEEKTGKVFLNQAPFSFDLSVMDLYTCLACGGTLYTLSKQVQGDFSGLLSCLKESDASVWVSTPSFADICLADPAFDASLLPKLSVFLFCGETLTNSTVKKLRLRFPDCIVMNTYGPTESTVAVTEVSVTSELNDSESPLPVGRAKPGTYIEIHDENGVCVPDGERGEIIIIGDTVSTGYYRQPELTEKAFFHTVRDGKTLRGYHTGDEGYLKNGMLYYCGRIDLQVKLNGYRIELEDIENNLLKLPYIESAVTVPHIRDGKVKSIAAFVICGERPSDAFGASRKIKKELKAFLPDYMIPKKILFPEKIPVTPNGKADRKKLGGLLS